MKQMNKEKAPKGDGQNNQAGVHKLEVRMLFA